MRVSGCRIELQRAWRIEQSVKELKEEIYFIVVFGYQALDSYFVNQCPDARHLTPDT
jgi:hypothetical protein